MDSSHSINEAIRKLHKVTEVYKCHGVLYRTTRHGKPMIGLRLLEYHKEYGTPDLFYTDMKIAKLEARLYMYNLILTYAKKYHTRVIAMSPASARAYAIHSYSTSGISLDNHISTFEVIMDYQNVSYAQNLEPLVSGVENQEIFDEFIKETE